MTEPKTSTDVLANRERFLNILQTTVKRDGIDKLIAYLTGESCDFFEAPASSKFHGAYVGGLCEHSLNVYDCLCDIMSRPRMTVTYGVKYPAESLAIAALMHDFCKINFYKTAMRNVKNEQGKWESVPYFTIEDTLPYGHGEKSVYIVSGFLRLTRDEAFAIRYHMGFSANDDAANVGKALEMFPLAFGLCCADMEASYFMEGSRR